MTGTITMFSGTRAFGFIEEDDTRLNYFVHISQTGGRTLRKGDRVNFEVGDDPRNSRRQMAVNVTLIEGEDEAIAA